MALVGKRFAFFHMPRTGGTWVRHALRIADPSANEIGAPHCMPGDVLETPGKVRFTVFREPLAWLASWQRLLAAQRDHLSAGIPDVLLGEDVGCRLREIHMRYRAHVDCVLGTEFLDLELPLLLGSLGYDGVQLIKEVPPAARNRIEQ